MKKLCIFCGVIILFISILGTKVNAQTTVKNWENLKEYIENSDKTDIVANLSIDESNIWSVNSTITIPKRKNCYNNI